jgi:Na+/serine symporter
MVAGAMIVRRCVGIGIGLLAAAVATKERSEIDVTGALHVIALLSVHTLL